MSKNRKIAFGVVVILLVYCTGFLSAQYVSSLRSKASDNTFPLLAKRILIDNPNDIRLDFRRLHADLETELQFFRYGDVLPENVSIFFEYLPTGVSVNVNGDMEVIAASLMKTAVAMQVYKSIENGELQMNQMITLTDDTIDGRFGDLYKKGAGTSISVRELIEKTLKESDNTAVNALKQVLSDKSGVLDLISSLDLEQNIKEDNFLISARSYSAIFKCLYFACYNTKADSQEILSYLTNTIFDNRLTGLLPDSVEVAHKIGSFNDEFQSDCGIVYTDNNDANYLLCVMIRGEDPEASSVIARVSYKIYSYMNNTNQ